MAPAKTSTTIAVLGSLCDDVEDQANTENPTAVTVAKESTKALEEAHDTFLVWRHT